MGSHILCGRRMRPRTSTTWFLQVCLQTHTRWRRSLSQKQSLAWVYTGVVVRSSTAALRRPWVCQRRMPHLRHTTSTQCTSCCMDGTSRRMMRRHYCPRRNTAVHTSRTHRHLSQQTHLVIFTRVRWIICFIHQSQVRISTNQMDTRTTQRRRCRLPMPSLRCFMRTRRACVFHPHHS